MTGKSIFPAGEGSAPPLGSWFASWSEAKGLRQPQEGRLGTPTALNDFPAPTEARETPAEQGSSAISWKCSTRRCPALLRAKLCKAHPAHSQVLLPTPSAGEEFPPALPPIYHFIPIQMVLKDRTQELPSGQGVNIKQQNPAFSIGFPICCSCRA